MTKTAALTTTSAAHGGTAVVPTGETSASTLAAQARAEIEAMFAIADARPRDEVIIYERILVACKRPRFAEAAVYQRPVGREKNADGKWVDKIATGLSVRFAEEARRLWGNIIVRNTISYEDDEVRHIMGTAIDLETRASAQNTFVVDKVVERTNPREGEVILGVRRNSHGAEVFKVQASESQLFTKTQNLAAKQRRGLILELLPADLKEEALEVCSATTRATIEADNKEERGSRLARMIDVFGDIGVSKKELRDYAGDLDDLGPAGFAKLLQIYNAMKDGEITWDEITASASADPDDSAAEPGSDLSDKLAKQAASKAKGRTF